MFAHLTVIFVTISDSCGLSFSYIQLPIAQGGSCLPTESQQREGCGESSLNMTNLSLGMDHQLWGQLGERLFVISNGRGVHIMPIMTIGFR